MKRTIYAGIFTSGLILALGVAGGSDAELLSTAAINRGLIIAAAMILISFYGLWLEDQRDKNEKRIRRMRDDQVRSNKEDEEEVPGWDFGEAHSA